MQIDQEALLLEASAWPDDKEVNWSALGTKYGLTNPNCGPILEKKWYQSSNDSTTQSDGKMKLPGEEISQLQHKPVAYQKAQVTEKIKEGEYCMGTRIAPSRIHSV